MSETPEGSIRVQPSTGKVLPIPHAPLDGVVEPTFWQGLDVRSQGAEMNNALPEVAQNEAEYQWQQDQIEETPR